MTEEPITIFRISLPFIQKDYEIRDGLIRTKSNSILILKTDTKGVERMWRYEEWGIICNYSDSAYTDYVYGELTEIGRQIMNIDQDK